MKIEAFHATVQYNDWRGTAAADSADPGVVDAGKWLEKKGLIGRDDFLLGIEIWAGENHGSHEDPISVTFLLVPKSDHDAVSERIGSGEGPIKTKKVEVEMSVTEFFGLFKRLAISFSRHGLLDQREYTYED